MSKSFVRGAAASVCGSRTLIRDAETSPLIVRCMCEAAEPSGSDALCDVVVHARRALPFRYAALISHNLISLHTVCVCVLCCIHSHTHSMRFDYREI